MKLPIPPLVNQVAARLPDGNLDPARFTDCGEACFSSAFFGANGVLFAPGCIRQALNLPEDNGVTTATDLINLWNKLGGKSRKEFMLSHRLWSACSQLRNKGRYMLLLGGWLSPTFGHWVLAYQRNNVAVDVMGPGEGIYTTYSPQWLNDRSWNTQVILE